MNDSPSNPFDWPAIRQRIDKAFAAIDREANLSPAEIQQILQERAKVLADESDSAEASDALEILAFQLGHERYGVETCYVREVHPLDNLTTLPGIPDFVTGVVNIRGEIVSVIDIKRFFKLPERGITHLNKIIVLEYHSMMFGILADEIDGVRQLPLSEVDASRSSPAGIDGGYVQGITTSGLALLDGRALLTDEEIVVQ